MTDTHPQFEDAIWQHYQGLKARGWSHPAEGDPNCPDGLFWWEENGQYGIRQIEAAWRGVVDARSLSVAKRLAFLRVCVILRGPARIPRHPQSRTVGA